MNSTYGYSLIISDPIHIDTQEEHLFILAGLAKIWDSKYIGASKKGMFVNMRNSTK